ncbi:hypothetical protein AB0L56_20540 [Streptomyces sp. NPDC052079]|uniref:hypothetical protein n=1 Tax=Streptomyces sp. NPDC052079 TaxID=3155526 RepID=UPI003420A9D4
MTGSATAADKGQQPENRQQALGTIKPVELPPAEPEQNQVKIGTGESCSPIASSAQAALGGAVKACVETKPLESASTVTARTAEQVAAAEACAITQPGYWGWTRTGGICLNGMQTTYTLYSDKGAVLGTGRMDVKSSMDLSSTSTTWNELITVKVTAVTGQVKNLNIAFDVNCTSACSPTTNRPWSGAKTLGLGAQASGSVTYKSNVASGARDSFQTKYHMYVTTTGSIPTQPNVNWDSPGEAKLRCDAELATPGCVIPERRATLEYSLSDPKHGSAAAAYSFAQGYLRDWAPLSRADGLSAANRARTCGSQSSDPFVPMPNYVPNDSCDEFPFAGSFEGGTDGAQCADILPLYENGQWMIYEARTDKPVTYNEPCVRGHVALDSNESAGGKYGAFVKNQRVLDTEKYNVNIVA